MTACKDVATSIGACTSLVHATVLAGKNCYTMRRGTCGTCRVASTISPALEEQAVQLLTSLATWDEEFAFVKSWLKQNLVQSAIETIGECSRCAFGASSSLCVSLLLSFIPPLSLPATLSLCLLV
jgi:hypothetical protein